MKNDDFLNFNKNLRKNMPELEINIWRATCEDKFKEKLHLSDLLYEFPAETRLTVYRRLDIPNRGELASPWPREDL